MPRSARSTTRRWPSPSGFAPVAVPERKHWHRNTHASPTTARTGAWREGLEPWEAALCEAVLGRRMRALGYETSGLPRPRAEHLARYARVSAMRKAAQARSTVRDGRERRREHNPVAALLTSGQRAAAGI